VAAVPVVPVVQAVPATKPVTSAPEVPAEEQVLEPECVVVGEEVQPFGLHSASNVPHMR
jgi:hypothetical protein